MPRGRPKKERFRKGETRAPRGEAAAAAIVEPAGDSDDEEWSPYHCSTCEGREHFSSIYKGLTSKGDDDGEVANSYNLKRRQGAGSLFLSGYMNL